MINLNINTARLTSEQIFQANLQASLDESRAREVYQWYTSLDEEIRLEVTAYFQSEETKLNKKEIWDTYLEGVISNEEANKLLLEK